MRDELTSLFLRAAQTVGQRLDELSLPRTALTEHMVVEREGPGTWKTAYVREPANVLTVGGIDVQGAPWLTQSDDAVVQRVAEKIAESAATTLPFFSPFGGRRWPLFDFLTEDAQGYDEDPAAWVAQHIVLPALHWHLKHLANIDEADDQAATAFADQVLEFANDDKLQYLLLIPLSGIDIAGEDLVADNTRMRRLSPREQGEWFREYGAGSGSLAAMQLEPPQVVIEVRAVGPRLAQYMASAEVVPRITTALQLHGYPVAGTLATEYAVPSWATVGSPLYSLTVPARTTTTVMLTATDFASVMATARALGQYNLQQPSSPAGLAVHRFMLGTARESAADAVLDFTITLEALLLPYDENARRGDLGYRFRMHGAYYLASNVAERPLVAKQLSSLYEMRSRLVHGGNYPDAASINAARDDARHWAERGLVRAIHEGFPRAQTFNKMVLGLLPVPDEHASSAD